MEDAILKEILRSYSCESAKGAISRLYKGLLTKKSYSTDYIKNKWEKEGDFEITKEEWCNCCELHWKCTKSHIWREFAWKCLIRFFTTPKVIIQGKTPYVGEDVGAVTQPAGIYCGNAQGHIISGQRYIKHWEKFMI